MRLSRTRLRLAAAFAVAFAAGLALLTAGTLAYLRWQANQRLDSRLLAVSTGVVQAIQREIADAPDSSVAFATHEVVTEWPANDDSFGIIDERGKLIAVADRVHAVNAIEAAAVRAGATSQFGFTQGDQDYHAVAAPVLSVAQHGHTTALRVIAYASTESVERNTEVLGGAFALATPIIVLLSLIGGYALARRALSPVSELRAEIGGIAPGDLARRLSVDHPHDEIGALAVEFNLLLSRLDEAQRRNRNFVREAAHQIRTPLTLVLGEAAHALDAPVDEKNRAVLARIRTAAEQMQRRVNELSLLAEAQAGEPVRRDDDVELDGLILECTDLMRARATGLGRALAIGRADHFVLRGNAMLLREAVLELIENACRHGDSVEPVTIAVAANAAGANITVESAGEAFAFERSSTTTAPTGLGLPIVDWIAREHGGELRVTREADRNVVTIAFGSCDVGPRRR